MKTKPKILLWDIETSLMTVTSFSLWTKYIPYDAIVDDWHIICGAYKWLGEKEVHTVEVDLDCPTYDYDVVKKLRDVIAEADIVVHHNGDKFDLKKLNARMVYWGIEPFPQPLTIDTLKVAKKEFAFTSNRLDYIGKYLGLGGKIKNKENLWQKFMSWDYDKSNDALKKMLTYNKRDVKLLESVYKKLRPYIKNHPNLNLFITEGEVCPNCKSKHLVKQGYRFTRSGKYQRYQCGSCGAWSKSTKVISRVEIN